VLNDARSGRSHPRLDLLAAMRAPVPVPNDSRSAARVLPGWGGLLTQTTPTSPRLVGHNRGAMSC
jgi:hypothetical protein